MIVLIFMKLDEQTPIYNNILNSNASDINKTSTIICNLESKLRWKILFFNEFPNITIASLIR